MTPPTMSLSSKELPIDSTGRRDSGVVASILQAGLGSTPAEEKEATLSSVFYLSSYWTWHHS